VVNAVSLKNNNFKEHVPESQFSQSDPKQGHSNNAYIHSSPESTEVNSKLKDGPPAVPIVDGSISVKNTRFTSLSSGGRLPEADSDASRQG
jgi:hypothetical protein